MPTVAHAEIRGLVGIGRCLTTLSPPRNRACDFHRTRLLGFVTLVVGSIFSVSRGYLRLSDKSGIYLFIAI
jgi:hypothetical protein